MEKKWKRILIGVFDIIAGVSAFMAVFVIAMALSHSRSPLPSLKGSLFSVMGFFDIRFIYVLLLPVLIKFLSNFFECKKEKLISTQIVAYDTQIVADLSA